MELWQQVIVWVVSPSFILAIALLIYRDRPKPTQDDLKLSYINDETSQKIEVRELKISWGHLPLFRQLELMEIQRTADYEITFNPIEKAGMETPVPTDCYTEKTGSVGRLVFLTNRGFFGRNKVKCVCFLQKSPLNQDYRGKIAIKVLPTYIEILNSNPIEIRNFTFQIPNDIKLEKLLDNEKISDIKMEIPSPYLAKVIKQGVHKCQEEGFVVKATLSENLPPKQGETPGKCQVQFS